MSSEAPGFLGLLRGNRGYRALWAGQIVSEVGDHFNSIACLSLTLQMTNSGLAVGAVMIARTLPAMLAGPAAGVLLDRMDRRRIMIWSDLIRAAVALAFILVPLYRQTWLLYLLSGLLTFASPFFTSGRAAILPTVASPRELHTANALTQTTSWLTLSIGTFLGGASTAQFGYEWAFVANAGSFLFSAWMIALLKGSFRVLGRSAKPAPWRDLREGLGYMRRTPIVLAVGLATVGWASGGGAAQILFTLFGEIVFNAGPGGIGLIWGFAGVGLVLGGLIGHRIGGRLSFEQYKAAIGLCFVVIGGAYMLFSVMPVIGLAVVFITISRVAMGVNNVLNRTMLLTHVPNQVRGRVLATIEAILNGTMMLSMMGAGVASKHFSIRGIGVAAGALTACTAVFWVWANWRGRLPEPEVVAQSQE
jgi:MFS family permease